MRILFVDNHREFTATVIECFLRDHDVVVVTTITEARERFEVSNFDVVLVDYDLDDGKGDEYVRWLRSRDADANVVAVSAREAGNEALLAAGANAECAKSSFARISLVLKELVAAASATSPSSEPASGFHHDLIAALQAQRGLILVAGPTGHGKTTAIQRVLADATCPPNVLFAGDLRGDFAAARDAVSASRSRVVVAVLRIPRAAGAFRRLLDMEVAVEDVVEVALEAFSTRLIRPSNKDGRKEFLLLHERIVVTDSIRALVLAGANEEAIHRCALAEGMRSLRQLGLDHVRARRLAPETVELMTPVD